MSQRPQKSYNYWKGIAHQVTFEYENFQSAVDIARAGAFYEDGLEGCARGSNQLLRDYIYN